MERRIIELGEEAHITEDAVVSVMPSYPPVNPRSPELRAGDELVDFSNRRFVPKYSKTYELEKYKKKGLLIINQVHIRGYRPRAGSYQDAEALRATFSGRGFEVERHDDLTKNEVFCKLKDFTKRCQHDHYGCLAVAILTHGGGNGLLYASDESYNELELLNQLTGRNNHGLISKPRILIIQACRGTQSTRGAAVLFHGPIQTDADDEIEPYFLPVEADMLVFHSSFVGRPSFRDITRGSWFIQVLCKKIDEQAHIEHLESIMLAVKREIAIYYQHKVFNRRTDELDVNKQMPVVTSTLTRDLYLAKYVEAGADDVFPIHCWWHY